ncbi:MAG: sugar ABC transporter substrate-binding protein [Spirochaetae bacterium HGW-Spirochaetae-4]|jgi:multiple sugar transport system substrate-binding protein|nr:MAG: sugar ABC transporter substrate-binding protein [Spirochaetae bacterium HGW-Spirochaetae-8]PKL22789.1 MAG: sugar ABC transporter substrate-binding protein [Spirochaetae bacterium HGW-Spirochaetae-4]
MKRVIAVALILLIVGSFAFAQGGKEKTDEVQVVKFWYHFDNPETALNPLIEKFEAENPGIKIEPERISWDTYNQKLLTSIAGGYPPDVAQVKLWWQPQLVEMGALLPLDDYIADWDGKDDIHDRIWELTRHSDGKQYYMPLQMVILYLYYRADMFEELGLAVPKTREEFLDVAKKLTRDLNGDGIVDVYGFGIRGARGGHDWWGTFVLSSGAEFFDANGNSKLTTPQAIAANQWFIDLYTKHKVSPPTTPSDGFVEVIANMKSGKTAMTIHHLGSAKELEAVLGDKISAAPVPKGAEGYWTSFGDEENAIFAATKVPDAAFKWASFLAEAENNAIWQKSSGQVSVNKSNASADADRFLKATTDSAEFAGVLPAHPGVSEFVESLWPALMQQAFAGQITSTQMMQSIEDHFAK